MCTKQKCTVCRVRCLWGVYKQLMVPCKGLNSRTQMEVPDLLSLLPESSRLLFAKMGAALSAPSAAVRKVLGEVKDPLFLLISSKAAGKSSRLPCLVFT